MPYVAFSIVLLEMYVLPLWGPILVLGGGELMAEGVGKRVGVGERAGG